MGFKSGLLNLSTGVGTVMIYVLQSPISVTSVIYVRLAAFNSFLSTSNVLSMPSCNCLIRSLFRSNPTVGYFLLNSIAKGSPT